MADGFKSLRVTFEFTVPEGTKDGETADAIFDVLCAQDFGDEADWPYRSCDGWDLA